MKKFLLSLFFTLSVYLGFSCGSAPAPYISGPLGSNTAASQASLGTARINQSCESGVTLNFNITDDFKNSGGNCGSYTGQNWYVNGSFFNSNAGSIFLNFATYQGSVNVRVATKWSNGGVNTTCSKNFYYNFNLQSFVPEEDFEPTVINGNGGTENEGASVSFDITAYNTGDDLCPPTQTVSGKMYWTDVLKDVVVSEVDFTLTIGTASNQSITVPNIDDFPLGAADTFNPDLWNVELHIEVNDDEVVSESDYGNNIKTEFFTIQRVSNGRTERNNYNFKNYSEIFETSDSDIQLVKIVDLTGAVLWQSGNNDLKYKDFEPGKLLIRVLEIDGVIVKEKFIVRK